MKNETQIDGVTITRAQAEAALKAMNEPEVPTAAEKHGMVRVGHTMSWLLLDPTRVRSALESAEASGGMVALHVDGKLGHDRVVSNYSDFRVRFMFNPDC